MAQRQYQSHADNPSRNVVWCRELPQSHNCVQKPAERKGANQEQDSLQSFILFRRWTLALVWSPIAVQGRPNVGRTRVIVRIVFRFVRSIDSARRRTCVVVALTSVPCYGIPFSILGAVALVSQRRLVGTRNLVDLNVGEYHHQDGQRKRKKRQADGVGSVHRSACPPVRFTRVGIGVQGDTAPPIHRTPRPKHGVEPTERQDQFVVALRDGQTGAALERFGQRIVAFQADDAQRRQAGVDRYADQDAEDLAAAPAERPCAECERGCGQRQAAGAWRGRSRGDQSQELPITKRLALSLPSSNSAFSQPLTLSLPS